MVSMVTTYNKKNPMQNNKTCSFVNLIADIGSGVFSCFYSKIASYFCIFGVPCLDLSHCWIAFMIFYTAYRMFVFVGPLMSLFDGNYLVNFIYELIVIFTPYVIYLNTYLRCIYIPSMRDSPLTLLRTFMTIN